MIRNRWFNKGVLAAVLLVLGAGVPLAAAPVVILKLDDFTCRRPGRRPVFPAAWLPVHEYLTGKNIKYSIGVHCEMFEENHPQTLDWMKEQLAAGRVEFWCHGYRAARNKLADGKLEPGEFERSFEEQKAILEKCRDLSQAALGRPFRAFGPHWSNTTSDTARALAAVPEFRFWLYGPADPAESGGLYSFPRYLALEYKTFIPNLEQFKKQWESRGRNKEVVVLQGHPKSWMWEKGQPRFAEFKKIIEFLESEGCTFSTPSEYCETKVVKP
ncbi:MAG: hypothetical protein ACI406_11855 [Victivallis vadensis]